MGEKRKKKAEKPEKAVAEESPSNEEGDSEAMDTTSKPEDKVVTINKTWLDIVGNERIGKQPRPLVSFSMIPDEDEEKPAEEEAPTEEAVEETPKKKKKKKKKHERESTEAVESTEAADAAQSTEATESAAVEAHAPAVSEPTQAAASEPLPSDVWQDRLFPYVALGKTAWRPLEEPEGSPARDCVAEGIAFMRKNTLEEIQQYWRENKRQVTLDYRQKSKDATKRQRKMVHRTQEAEDDL